VTLAARDPYQAQAIRDTGRNPRYQRDVDLSDVAATTVDDAPYEDADVVVAGDPSKAFGQTVRSLPGARRSSA
jgi:glycerol-3-phosphate dehydrogenase